MIKLTGHLGKPIYVKAREISAIYPSPDNVHAILRVGSTGFSLHVKETCEEVNEMTGYARN